MPNRLRSTLVLLVLAAPLAAQSPEGLPPGAPAAPFGRPAGGRPAPGSFGAPHPSPDRWWGDRRLLPALDLPAEQLARLEATYQSARGELDALDRRVGASAAEVARQTRDAAPTAAALALAVDAWTTARRDLEVAHLRLLLTLRSQLSLEQWRRLRELQRSGPAPAGPGRHPRDDSRVAPATRPSPKTLPEPNLGPRPPGPIGPPGGFAPSPPGNTGNRASAAPRGVGLPAGPPLPPGLWWHDEDGPRLPIDLADGQREELDAVFARRRGALETARAALEREERLLGPRLAAEPVELAPALDQVARVADARRDLERELLGLRSALWLELTPGQRQQLLQALPSRPPRDGPPRD